MHSNDRRGARLTPEKKKFWIVEFTDTMRRFASQVFHASDLFPANVPAYSPSRSRAVSGAQHTEPLGVPQFENADLGEAGIITFTRDQTFGVEIELTTPAGIPTRDATWESLGRLILGRLGQAVSGPVDDRLYGYHQGQDSCGWHLEYDSSAGWEIVSPVLSNAEGFQELRRACDVLADLQKSTPQLHVNYRTGLHITLGTRLNTNERFGACCDVSKGSNQDCSLSFRRHGSSGSMACSTISVSTTSIVCQYAP